MAASGCHAPCRLLLHLHQKLQWCFHRGGSQKHKGLLLCHVCWSRRHAGLVDSCNSSGGGLSEQEIANFELNPGLSHRWLKFKPNSVPKIMNEADQTCKEQFLCFGSQIQTWKKKQKKPWVTIRTGSQHGERYKYESKVVLERYFLWQCLQHSQFTTLKQGVA